MATEQEVAAARAKGLPQLRPLPGITGCYIERNEAGDWVVVVTFEKVTPDERRAVAAIFPDVPVEVRVMSRFRVH
jgi:hypothetical protein